MSDSGLDKDVLSLMLFVQHFPLLTVASPILQAALKDDLKINLFLTVDNILKSFNPLT